MMQSSSTPRKLPENLPAVSKSVARHETTRLGELPATAICGNDITSSCLYVSALAIIYSGKYAWISLLMVGAVLFLFRKIYAEVVGALPLNGGAYNALLNTTTKSMASVAACLTILSYMATAVISANEAMHYLRALWSPLPVLAATLLLLFLFMTLSILGIGESSRVAMAIFVFHIAALLLLLVFGSVYLLRNGLGTFTANLAVPSPSMPSALFFGFSAAMLGISGFESSANFVEEQQPGVFPKTLRNMWVAVSFFNPSIALLALALVPIAAVRENENALLSHMGTLSGGRWLSTLISIDAALVLSGAVLTSYVGVTGLIRRMALDRCLPQFLLKVTRRGTDHRIAIGFFLLAASVLLITAGDLRALAGVYTISFLSVMVLFGLGNVLLKVKRSRLPRPARASWSALLLGIAAVAAGLIGNIVLNPAYVRVFLSYLIPALLVVFIMLGRVGLLKAMLFLVRRISESIRWATNSVSRSIESKIQQINSQQIVYFTRGDNIANLNDVMWYIRRNEHTNRVKIVRVVKANEAAPQRLRTTLEFLDQAYPEIDIEFVEIEGEFGPVLIRHLSATWNIPTNLMFISSPSHGFPYGLAELGGVRLII